MFKFKISYVALAAALASTSVYADPASYTHLSGAKVIDIEAPNAAGVSHNIYREFNVNSKGTILNNSDTDVAHSTLGNLAKNNNLTGGGASVILNEVVSTKASALNGFLEVNGQKADIVIANPNGISCSGCSFINTDKVVLTTGKVNMSSTGAISSYSVTQGNISINGNGMNAQNSYAVLLADAINLNGVVNAKNAMISAGNFTLDNSTGAITSANKQPTLWQMIYPEYSIDVSAMGGVKADSITMVGNNLGFGVRNNGAIVANNTLTMASNGSLVNEGSITGKGLATQLASLSNLTNKGTISTNYIGIINSQGEIYNEGKITNNTQMALTAAGKIENKGTISSKNLLAVTTYGDLNTQTGSWLMSDNTLSVTALGNINNGGSTRGKNIAMSFGGSEMKVTGNVMAQETLQVLASKNDALTTGFINNNGTLSGKNMTVVTKGSLLNDGVIRTTENMSINTHNGVITNRNSITSAGDMTLSTNKVVNGGYKCGFLSLSTCDAGTLTANKLILNSTHKYASSMGGNQQFKATQITTR